MSYQVICTLLPSWVRRRAFLEDEAQKVDFLPSKEVGGTLNAEYLLFRLNALEKARELAAELRDNKEKYGCQTKFDNGGLEIDLTDVENKENLGIFSKFARLLSFAVVVLALILIINYTGAILRMHISQNKRNLGTLMALGMRIRPSQGFTSSSHRCCWVQRLSSATCWSGRLGTWGWSCSCLLPGWTMWPQKLPSPTSRFTTLLCYSSQFLWPSSLTASGSSSRLLREIWCTTVNPSA